MGGIIPGMLSVLHHSHCGPLIPFIYRISEFPLLNVTCVDILLLWILLLQISKKAFDYITKIVRKIP